MSETQSAAQAAAGAMRGVSLPPGRKVLLLISGGWPSLPRRPLLAFPELAGKPETAAPRETTSLSSRNSPEDPAILQQTELPTAANLASSAQLFEPVTGTANLLGYTIYPITLAQHGWAMTGADAEAAAPTPIENLGFISALWALNVNDAMGYMARETGGKVLFNTLRTSVFKRIEGDTARITGWASPRSGMPTAATTGSPCRCCARGSRRATAAASPTFRKARWRG